MHNVVWFKRDLRVADHAPLAYAAAHGSTLPLYVIEPSIFRAPDFAAQHWGFIRESLVPLSRELATLGSPLVVRVGELPDVLAQLQRELGSFRLLSHQETGNGLTYARDLAVAKWCRTHSVEWREFHQHGVIRRLSNRNAWAAKWDALMAKPLINTPHILTPPMALPSLSLRDLVNLEHSGIIFREADKAHRQHGGRAHGIDLLISFLEARGQHYRTAMSSPISAGEQCSRLSAHIAVGTLSIREIAHALAARRATLLAMAPEHRLPGMLASLKSFEARLHWHCHFIQKLESEPAIENRNVHRGFDHLRNEGLLTTAEQVKLRLWCRGETGYPMVDACMKMLIATGWINFRMRAMLMSFASYQLWLHWREPALHLAREFLDYEPGIHYPQTQMQSGVTGINTIRIYNPIKQARDQDPDGCFVRAWLPALASVPTEYIFEPWTMPQTLQEHTGCLIGTHYPAPIVDNAEAARFAREAIHAVRKQSSVRDEAQRVYQKHGSRQRPRTKVSIKRADAPDRKPVVSPQLAFSWETPGEQSS